jgi:hypothetical protein
MKNITKQYQNNNFNYRTICQSIDWNIFCLKNIGRNEFGIGFVSLNSGCRPAQITQSFPHHSMGMNNQDLLVDGFDFNAKILY